MSNYSEYSNLHIKIELFTTYTQLLYINAQFLLITSTFVTEHLFCYPHYTQTYTQVIHMFMVNKS